MYVELCWRTKETAEGKVHVSNQMTVKEAMGKYKEIESRAIKAYLRRFDGWQYRIHRRLKDSN